MNICLISQDVNKSKNSYDSAVVYAESEHEAKTAFPFWCANKYQFADPEDVKVQLDR